MRKFSPLFPLVLASACLAPSQAVLAGELSPAAVTFAPSHEATFKRQYGAREVQVLRSQIVQSVSQSLKSVGSECSRNLDVTIERAAPTHPTMQQQMRDPSLDPTRTVFRDSGAALTGQVLDSSRRVLATVKYEYFSSYMPIVAPAKDPWSQARVAIDAFSHRLVDACVKHSTE